MKKALWFAIALLALGTAAFGGAVSGVSNTFGIDNTMGGPPPIPSWYRSPYTGPGSVLLRGQLHAHSYHDGGVPGSDVGEAGLAQMYRDRGYSFVACTNHNWVSGESIGWQGWAPNSCEITHGRPLSVYPQYYDGHVLALGNSGGTTFGDLDYESTWPFTADGMVVRISKTHARGGLAFVAHPDNKLGYGIPVKTLADIVSRSNPEGIAIHSVSSNAETKWAEVMNRLGRPVWGYVEDDYHPDVLSRDNLARTWVAVPGEPGEWWGNIKEKLRSGNYYSYWTNGAEWPGGLTPPRLGVTTESGEGGRPRITIGLSGMNLNSANRLEIIGKNGWGLAAVQNPSNTTYSYQCTGYEGRVRVRVWLRYSFGTLNISSQPIRVYKTGAYAPYGQSAASRMSTEATSPELEVQYLEPEQMPEQTPAAGYVGDLFMVSTADGLVPPGAVLTLSYEGESIFPLGGTDYLAIYRYDTGTSAWVKVGGTVDPATATIESAIDTLGIYTISADLPADTTAPQVFIENPPYGGVVSADTTVRATVNDNLGAWQVQFFLNDHLLAEDSNGEDGWSADIKIADYCTGDWTLKAVAEDLAGNSGSVEMPIYIVSLTPRPTVTIASPASGSALTGTVTASGTCGDDVAVASVMIEFDDTVVGFADIDGGNWTCDIDTGLLANGIRSLKAVVEDYPGNEATASVSVTINNPTVSVAGAKLIADGGVAGITGLVATAGTAEIGGAFYVEDADRFAGLRVSTDKTIAQGDMVSASGLMSTVEGERILAGADVLRLSSSNPLPKALGMVGRNVAGGMAGFIPGVSGGPHLNNVGLLVCTWGRVTQKGDGYLYVDDGSCQPDGTLTGMEPNAGIRVLCDPTAYNTGDLLFVTGISSCFDAPDGLIARRILTRKPEDVRKVY